MLSTHPYLMIGNCLVTFLHAKKCEVVGEVVFSLEAESLVQPRCSTARVSTLPQCKSSGG